MSREDHRSRQRSRPAEVLLHPKEQGLLDMGKASGEDVGVELVLKDGEDSEKWVRDGERTSRLSKPSLSPQGVQIS